MTDRPNIVLITAHDLGTHIGCYGWDPALPTPHLDRLAGEGVRFERHFCTAPFCSPSRGSITTGCYPHVNGLMGLVNLGWDIPQSNRFLPEQMKRAGYETALLGFQHVARDPSRLGYDYISERGVYGCRAVAGQAVDYLTQRSGGQTHPFFLEIGFADVHRPYGGVEEIPVREEDVCPLPYLPETPGMRMDLAMFYETIRRMDQSVGCILSALESSALAENTLIVFTTDHGIAFPRAKGTLYDPGIRTALLMRWPAGFSGGRVISTMVSSVDLFPTLTEITQGTAPDSGNGKSLLGLLRGERTEGRRMVFAEKNTSADDIKRCVRTDRFKYIRNYSAGPELALPTDISVSATHRDMSDAHHRDRPEAELYDLLNDPWEQVNLVGREEYSGAAKHLAAALQEILEDTHDPLLAGPLLRPPEEAGIMADIWSPEAMGRRAANEHRIQRAYCLLRDGR